MKTRKLIFLFLLTGTTVLLLATCVNKKPGDPRSNAYAGSDACRSCHPGISSSFSHTAHFLSTRAASEQSIAGLFTAGSNSLHIDSGNALIMERKPDGFFQVLYHNSVPVRYGRIDLVMGSVKGQTYLSRTADGYAELPGSWLGKAMRWTASPGFSLDRMTFDRPVTKRCFECHSAWMPDISTLSPGENPAVQAVLNIDCERCHGPAAAHVSFHESNPEVKAATAIVQIGRLTRKQQMDLCATCHSGTRQTMLRSTFSFRPGDSLEAFMIPDFTGTMPLDVHGNQARALTISSCFRNSALECNSCHNQHTVARGESESYNARCQGCHAAEGLHRNFATTVSLPFLKKHCTECHMPAQPSGTITVQSGMNASAMAVLIVNHRIAVYPEASAEILKKYLP